jgi:catechol 2,3-dioxygenase-like lactoylglutathione lyase family enzyme
MTDSTVRQLRLVVEVDDFETAVTFYRDVLGLPQQAAFEGDGNARVVILNAGQATLELANRQQAEMIDNVEVGHRCSPKFRVAFEVHDTHAVTERLVAGGATLIAAPIETPWRSLNSRLDAPGEVQLTLFEELETLDERSQRPGFQSD